MGGGEGGVGGKEGQKVMLNCDLVAKLEVEEDKVESLGGIVQITGRLVAMIQRWNYGTHGDNERAPNSNLAAQLKRDQLVSLSKLLDDC